MSTPIAIEVNCQTGDVTERPLTAEEIAQREADAAAAAAAEAEAAAFASAVVVAVAVAFALTQDIRTALAIGMIEPLVQTVFFTLHDRIWSRIEERRARTRPATA